MFNIYERAKSEARALGPVDSLPDKCHNKVRSISRPF